MTATKVSLSIDIEKLKAEKKLIAKKCCIEGCDNIGNWNNARSSFYTQKGMCPIHYYRFKTHGEDRVLRVVGEDRHSNILYSTYRGIKNRCYNSNEKAYKDYGGRGIKMSDEWLNDFNVFCRDMGEKPSPKHSVERRDNDLGYSKKNCYWAVVHQQTANRRSSNRTVGVSKTPSNTFVATLEVNRKYVLRKKFKTEQEAINARKTAEIEFLGKNI